MMKNKILSGFIRKAALVAAFFIAPISSPAIELPTGIKEADARVQRIFDQVVKLHRRYESGTKLQAEPLKSLLTELAYYHGEETATYLSETGTAGRRSGPILFAPWCLHRLAELNLQLGDPEEAIRHFHDLGERFPEALVISPSDGAKAFSEKVSAASLRGAILAFLEYAVKNRTEDVHDALEDRIEKLQREHGSEKIPGGRNGSSLALEYLWKSLELDKASYKTWRNETVDFAGSEKDAAFKGAVFEALSQGALKLGKKDDAEKYAALARRSAKDSDLSSPPQGIFSNLIRP